MLSPLVRESKESIMSTQGKPVLEVVSRDKSGKGVARKLRAKGLVPAVFYGVGTETRSFSVSPRAIIDLFATPKAKNIVFDIRVDGEEIIENVMVKTYQVTPVRRELLHVDFYRVDMDRPLRTKVPLRSVGTPAGVRLGGILNMIRPDIDIVARPADIPVDIAVDVADMNPGDTILAADVNLPEGVDPGFRANYGLFRIVMPRKKAALLAQSDEG